MWLLATALALTTAAIATSVRLRNAALVFFGLALSMCIGEAGFAIYHASRSNGPVDTRKYAGPRYYQIWHPEVGYAPTPGVTVGATRVQGDRKIYDVVYTITDQGVRSTKGDPNGPKWVFMGCSVTFGEGVNDDETLPSYFSAELGHSANVVNAGFHGYGPHQMLRLLEIDKPALGPPVKHVIYQGLAGHVRRSAGRVPWDLRGPSYRVTGGTVRYAGPFRSPTGAKLLRLVTRSDMGRFFIARLYFNADGSSDDIELYARIVERSAELARTKLGADFTILYWDKDTRESKRVVARLRKTGLPLLLVSTYIPRTEWKGLTIDPDSHPSPEAHRRLGVALARHFASTADAAAELGDHDRINPDNRVYLQGAQSRIQPSGPVPAGR